MSSFLLVITQLVCSLSANVDTFAIF